MLSQVFSLIVNIMFVFHALQENNFIIKRSSYKYSKIKIILEDLDEKKITTQHENL